MKLPRVYHFVLLTFRPQEHEIGIDAYHDREKLHSLFFPEGEDSQASRYVRNQRFEVRAVMYRIHVDNMGFRSKLSLCDLSSTSQVPLQSRASLDPMRHA